MSKERRRTRPKVAYSLNTDPNQSQTASEYDRLARQFGYVLPDALFGLCFEYLQPGQRLLDIGIGTGLSALPFTKAGISESVWDRLGRLGSAGRWVSQIRSLSCDNGNMKGSMKMTQYEHQDNMLRNERFPRSNRYDPKWIIDNQMGLNPLWLTEWVCEKILLEPGMRVLDLGCGKGLSSIFLANEYNVQVWAADLWVKPTENYDRFRQANVQDHVFPIHTDARNLPFSEGYFDAIICTDAYIYFGTDDLYLDYLHRFVKTGGWIGITVPGFMRELEGQLPEHILPFWAQECWTWHTLDWWRWHWERTGLLDEIYADVLPDGWKSWLQWKKARAKVEGENPSLISDIQVLEADRGRFMGFIRMVACRK